MMHPLKKLLLLFLLVPATTAIALDLSVMTFNVRYGLAKDGDNAWEHRKDFLIETIKQANPDVLGVQECLDFQAIYIAEKLPDFGWVGLGRQADGTGEMTAIFYRKRVLLPVETAHVWLSETPDVPGSKSWDSSLPRIASRVKFVESTTGRPFVFYNTHFDHRGQIARLESAKLLSARIGAETLPVVLVGDFNAVGGGSAPWAVLIENGLEDAWAIAAEKKGPTTTWNGFERPADDDRRIDWIVVTEGISVAQCSTLNRDFSGRYPSDHFPVTAQISLPNTD